MVERAKPWLMRTYSGHSTAAASNELYRANLAQGQTGLSIAFDLPTQTGYDPDAPEARGEVGRVGVPVSHLGHMEALLDEIPLEEMNTSMTINATAPWLLGLYLAAAQRRGVDAAMLQGTTQNDLVKEFLSRGTYIFGPEASRRLTVDVIAYTVANVPRWNPINVCSYHLQEAGATPVQEIAYALATAIDVLDAVRDSGKVDDDAFDDVVARISFFVNAGIRFVEETAKMRAFTSLWDHVCRDRYGVADPAQRRFRYGVQVNSLGLTEQQPENNVQRIVLELLGVTLSADARARAVQLPAWNEALGLPRQADQQWSLRIQQVLAFETDLLEYPDLFAGSLVMEAKTGRARRRRPSRARRRPRPWRRLRQRRRAQAPPRREPDRAGRRDRERRAAPSSASTASGRRRVAARRRRRGRGRSPSTRRSSASSSTTSSRGELRATTSPSQPPSTSCVAWRRSDDAGGQRDGPDDRPRARGRHHR